MKMAVLALILLANEPTPSTQQTPECVTLPDGMEFCVDADLKDEVVPKIVQCGDLRGVRMCGA